MFKKRNREEPSAETRLLAVDFGSTLAILLGMVTFALIAIASLAWFAANREVDSGDMSVNLDAALFELGVALSGDARRDAVDADAMTPLTEWSDRNYGTALETSGGQTGVVCALVTDDGEPLRPGSTGTLQFRLLPKKDDLIFTGQTVFSGLKKALDGENAIVYEPLDPTDSDEAKALTLLSSHLLFFRSAVYSAENRVDMEDGFQIQNADTAGQEYLVTFYWEWPRTYSDHDSYVDADWLARYTYLEDGEGDIGYNNADQVIGEYISYVVVELNMDASADPGADSVPVIAAAALS